MATVYSQEFLNQNKIDTSKIVAVGCDGTVVNTGKVNGVIALFESELKRPVQWLVCQIHGNELPLRHLIQKLDESTSGPCGWTGPIRSEIQFCET